MATMRWLVLGCLSAAMLSGCGYSQSNTYDGKRQGKYEWHSLYREDIKTVAVPIFTNRSFTRGVEFQLTKAIINYMESTTPYKVVAREQADTILEGEITEVKGGMISTDTHSTLPQEEMITVSVNFVWKDLRTGRVLAQQRNFQQSSHVLPDAGRELVCRQAERDGEAGNGDRAGTAGRLVASGNGSQSLIYVRVRLHPLDRKAAAGKRQSDGAGRR